VTTCGGKDTRTLVLGNGGEWPLASEGKSPMCSLSRLLGELQSQIGRGDKEKTSFLLLSDITLLLSDMYPLQSAWSG
jgi:hypothetical protein